MGWFGITPRRPSGGGLPRRAERYQTLGLSCPLGEVADLSACGMQLRCPGRPPAAKGDIRQFTISSGSQKLELTGRVVWVRRASWKSYRVGIQFLHLRPGVETALVQLAKYGFVGRRAGATAPAAPAHVVMEVENLYEILGVGAGAPPEEVHAAYRTLARAVHPDVCKDPEAGAQFILISKAYSVLRDPERRRKYDTLLAGCT